MSAGGRERVAAGVLLAAGVAMTAALVVWEGAGTGPAGVFVVFSLLQALNWWATDWLERRFRTETWQLDGALLAAGVVLLEPLGTTLGLSLGVLVGTLAVRMRATAIVFNVGQMLLGTAAATALARVLVGDEVLGMPAALAVVLASVVWSLISVGAVSFVLAVRDGDHQWGAHLSRWLRYGLVRTPFIGATGYVAGLAGVVSPVAPLLAVPTWGFLVYVVAEHLRAERDRDRAETLFRVATEAHASVDADNVAAALTEAASSLLQVEQAQVRDGAPADGETGVRLATTEQRWLVVRGTPVEDADQLLPAVAAIGASALENARLVQELRHQAVHDSLTGLPNQVLFADRVEQAIKAADPGRSRFAVVALDLDAFRKVNDSLGHAVGDELLAAVASRLEDGLRPGDTVARLSGDVFVVLLRDVGTAEVAGVLTEKLLGAVRTPVPLNGQDVYMSACAGLAFYPDDGRESGHLLRNADSALHRAKAHGPGSYQIYAHGMNELAHQRLARESELHQAIRRDELRVRYQPQVDLRTGRIIGLEALVRWEHPTLGLLGPDEFVDLAEESGLIIDVDTWMLRHAAQQAAEWLNDGVAGVRVAVNLSARHFQFPERLIGTIRDVLDGSNLPPMLLELEVTEGLAVIEEQSVGTLQRVRDLGVSISIDDFGTGYSMLGRLSRFPVDRLKIDRGFVREIATARDDAPIVSAIIAMARSLRIETVAEGVETLEQQTVLRNRGGDLAQGYLFSKPASASTIGRLLRTPSVGFSVGKP